MEETKKHQSSLLGIDFYLSTAKQHGDDVDPDCEVGDLQVFLREMWGLLTPAQRIAFAMNEQVLETVEAALPSFDEDVKARARLFLCNDPAGFETLASRVATQFVVVLREWLTKEQWREMLDRNEAAAPGVCHSHDFCDANMAMAEAFDREGLPSPADVSDEPVENEVAVRLWNRAWDLASPGLGKPKMLRKLGDDELSQVIEESLNGAVLPVQQAIGQDDGGWAGIFFSGGEYREMFEKVMRGYLEAEYLHAGMLEHDIERKLRNRGFENVPTGGGFSALMVEKGAFFLCVNHPETMTAKINGAEMIDLWIDSRATGEEVYSLQGTWPEIEAVITAFLETGEVPA